MPARPDAAAAAQTRAQRIEAIMKELRPTIEATVRRIVERAVDVPEAEEFGAIDFEFRGAGQKLANAVRQAGESGLRHRFEHCALPTRAQAEQMAELGMWAVLQPSHYTTTGDWVAETVGAAAEHYSPTGLFERCGTNWALSSDAPVAWPNPLEAVAGAVDRHTVGGRALGPEHAVTVEQALRAHTIDAAKAIGTDHAVGSITPGKYADFTILEDNPLRCPVGDLAGIKIAATWINGVPAWCA